MKVKANGINLFDTLFSGQCFRMIYEKDDSYTVILADRVVNIKECDDYLEVDSNNLENLEEVINDYFDLNRDYENTNKIIEGKSEVLKRDIHLCEGYHILKQDPFEMFITYIISQNNNVKRIAGSVDKLSRLFGKMVVFRDKEYYLFPTYEEMKDISLEELRSIGVGFRDKYIRNALDKLDNDRLFLDRINNLSTEEALKELTSIKGIGTKVASCILLFGYLRFDTYPIDTWVRHFVSANFDIKDDMKSITSFMKETFKEYSGLAIQYFFHIERNKKNRS